VQHQNAGCKSARDMDFCHFFDQFSIFRENRRKWLKIQRLNSSGLEKYTFVSVYFIGVKKVARLF
jgi:hypothetical protein